MYHDFNFASVLAASARAAWQIDDVLPAGAALDFTRPFMPENLARTGAADGLSDAERRVLNQIRGHEYLVIFGLVEEFILPFVLDHARPQLNGDDARVRALLTFASEEAKHIDLFKRFHARFVEGFGTECGVIGPPEAVAAEVLRHDPLAVALAILHIEWMTQHAKLDTLMVEALAEGRDEAAIQRALDEYLEIGMFLDNGLKAQTGLNLAAFEAATGRTLAEDHRAALEQQQHQALRWTYLGSGMTHPKFVATLAAISPAARDRIAEVAPAFC
jgi:hypothetical protein